MTAAEKTFFDFLKATLSALKWPTPITPSRFSEVLDRCEIVIYQVGTEPFTRKMTDQPFSNGFEYWGWTKKGWECGLVRCDDMKDPEYINGKMQIFVCMYFNPHSEPNLNWGDVPVMTIDFLGIGESNKDFKVDGKVVNHYDSYSGIGIGKTVFIEGERLGTADVSVSFKKPLRIFYY